MSENLPSPAQNRVTLNILKLERDETFNVLDEITHIASR